MITDPSAAGPAATAPGLWGIGRRDVLTAAAAGLVAEIAFVVLMALVALVSHVVLPGCEGDSCIGSPRLYAGVLVSPLVLFAALVGAVLVLRVRRPWAVAGVALPVALVLLGAGVAALLGVLQASRVLTLLAAGFAVACGPVATVAATALVDGRGPLRFVPVPAVVALVVLVVVASRLLVPGWQAGRVTALVPQPYAYEVPGAVLNSLNANRYTGVLELNYIVGEEEFVDVDEVGPVTAAARAGACSPALPVGEPSGLCRRLPSPSVDVTVWRSGPGASGADEAYVVVARPDVTIVLFATTMADDAAALALVARLHPVDARTLLDAAENVYV
ncbi:hypothetical protein [Kineosporia sp. A_224]|uniref:hypothetical protein n=1 Tax=Kineosporia sp. A_224 TaxID=1962180 RepID=UPI000B4AE652|nr:hypothetical protein [Kineosporia sp. A_224]